MSIRTIAGLRSMQAAPLEVKLVMTQRRIAQWVDEWGEDGVYVSFSGGKDSTVLLDIARKMYPNLKAMFVDIPTQYPELKQFVQTFDNVDIVKPKMNFFQVCEKYGFPIISKENAGIVFKVLRAKKDRETLANYKKLCGTFKNPKSGRLSLYNAPQVKYFLDAPFAISNECCTVMKHKPCRKYEKETGRVPITAQMAYESTNRRQKWIEHGCNMFDVKNPISNPMSFWTEQDVLKYIRKNNISICSVYGDIVSDAEEMGQMNFADFGIENAETKEKLHCTGCQRTGCVLCAFGAHLERERENARFVRLKQTHPKMYQLLDICKNNGVTYREALEWINAQGHQHIYF